MIQGAKVSLRFSGFPCAADKQNSFQRFLIVLRYILTVGIHRAERVLPRRVSLLAESHGMLQRRAARCRWGNSFIKLQVRSTVALMISPKAFPQTFCDEVNKYAD